MGLLEGYASFLYKYVRAYAYAYASAHACVNSFPEGRPMVVDVDGGHGSVRFQRKRTNMKSLSHGCEIVDKKLGACIFKQLRFL